MNRRSAFTLIELIIAFSLSSFVILGMMQSYQNVVNFINNTGNLLFFNKRACLLIDQMEKDLSASFIPTLYEEQEKDKKKAHRFFVAKSNEDDFFKIEGERKKLFQSLSFITTNPLQIFEQQKVRLVRVGYKLEKDKAKSNQEKNVYNLFRYETYDINNVEFKEKEMLDITKDDRYKYHINKILVGANVKNLFIKYFYEVDNKRNKTVFFSEDNEKDKNTFVWGEKEEQKNSVPKGLEIYITLWGEKLRRETFFEFFIPIFSYPTIKESLQEKKPEDHGEKEDLNKKEDKQYMNNNIKKK